MQFVLFIIYYYVFIDWIYSVGDFIIFCYTMYMCINSIEIKTQIMCSSYSYNDLTTLYSSFCLKYLLGSSSIVQIIHNFKNSVAQTQDFNLISINLDINELLVST